MSVPTPVWTVRDLARAAGCHARWLQVLARREGLGRYAGNRLTFEWDEAERLLRLVRDSVRGRPRTKGKESGTM